MRKILHINDYPAQPALGGAEVVLARTVQLLREAGFVVDTFTQTDLPDPRRTVGRYLRNDIACQALRAKLRTLEPDVVHLHNYYHLLSPAILNVLHAERQRRPMRVVMTLHDYHLICPNAGGHWAQGQDMLPIDPSRADDLAYWLFRRWDRRGLAYSVLKQTQHFLHRRWLRQTQLPDLVICASRFLQACIKPIIANTLLLPHPAPPTHGILGDRPARLRLIYVGRLEPEKGLTDFLRSMPTDFPGELVIVGAGAQRTDLEALARRRGLTVDFRGRLDRTDTLTEIARSHLLVQPSKCLETYGLTLIEALSLGANILASDRGALREIVDASGVGWLYDPNTPASLVETLDKVIGAYEQGTLNRFDVRGFLGERSEVAYLTGMLNAYRVESAVRRAAA